ncbi:hypothetical protein D3C81_2188860 [compost metagenome]
MRLRRIPYQFDPENPDPVRLGIDVDFLKALRPDLEDEVIRPHLLELYKRVDTALKQWTGRD